MPWPAIAQAFGLPVDGPGSRFGAVGGGQTSGKSVQAIVWVVLILLFICASIALDDGDGLPSRWNTLRALRVLKWYERAN